MRRRCVGSDPLAPSGKMAGSRPHGGDTQATMSDAILDLLLVQTSPVWHAPEANHSDVRARIEEAGPRSGTLVVLPETFATGFTFDPAMAQERGAATDRFLSEVAEEHGVWIVAGLLRRGGDGTVRNCAVAVDPEGIERAVYAKRRPFRPGGEPWTAGVNPVVFEIRGVRVALHVCFDLRFPELFRDTLTPEPPAVHVVIASWPVARIADWELLMRSRAIENQAWVVGVNRTGNDPANHHVGSSLICDPSGLVRVHAGTEPGVVGFRCDVGQVFDLRERLPFLPGAHS